jgi:single-strand DNA-binding protein
LSPKKHVDLLQLINRNLTVDLTQEVNMSGSLNRAQLIGHLGKKPEVRTNLAGGKVVSFPVATSERWTDERTGERVERTEWHRIVIFNPKLGELAEKYLDKGSRVFIEGLIRTRKWQDREGVDRYTTEIQLPSFNGTLTFLDSKQQGETGDVQPEGEADPQPAEAPAPEEGEAEAEAPSRRGRKAKA